VQVWIRDDDVLDAGQRDPLACVRRIYMRFEIALTQLWGVLQRCWLLSMSSSKRVRVSLFMRRRATIRSSLHDRKHGHV